MGCSRTGEATRGFVTHELRNPLTTAMLGATRLRRKLELSPEPTKMFDIVERNQRRLAELIDGVPFRRGHPGETGSGLGLAIARRAVESQGGSTCRAASCVWSTRRSRRARAPRSLRLDSSPSTQRRHPRR